MKDWTVSLSFSVGDDVPDISNHAKDVILRNLVGRCPILGYEEGSLDLTFDVLADDVETAVSQAKQGADDALLAADLPPLQMQQLLITGAPRRRRDDQRIPDLVGIAEIADLLDVSKQRAHQLSKTSSFPTPIVQLRSGPVYRQESIREWDSSRSHR